MNAGYSNSKSLLNFVACDCSHSGSKLKSYVCLPARDMRAVSPSSSAEDLCEGGLFVGMQGFYSNSDVMGSLLLLLFLFLPELEVGYCNLFLKIPESIKLAFKCNPWLGSQHHFSSPLINVLVKPLRSIVQNIMDF
ncbi:hypothetical protein AMECASPLE_026458 [Ameca splendens]|uniref:Uncharacterized protein n=1 Tax=Ameca splendens TaxID=208324 RepID=A0ABV0Y5I0_9TELE